jgi:hypothetical protein
MIELLEKTWGTKDTAPGGDRKPFAMAAVSLRGLSAG